MERDHPAVTERGNPGRHNGGRRATRWCGSLDGGTHRNVRARRHRFGPRGVRTAVRSRERAGSHDGSPSPPRWRCGVKGNPPRWGLRRTARGQRGRGDAIRLPTRSKPSKGVCVTGKAPTTECVLRHPRRGRGWQRGEPQVRHRAATCSKHGSCEPSRWCETTWAEHRGGVAAPLEEAATLREVQQGRVVRRRGTARQAVRQGEEGPTHVLTSMTWRSGR